MAFLAERPSDPEREIDEADTRIAEKGMTEALRALVIDAMEAERIGESDIPLGLADAATVLWTRFLKFDAADPQWPDRDRFVLSADQGRVLLHALLHLTGHADVGIDRPQMCGARAAASGLRLDRKAQLATELIAGPAGQGVAQAVGMALAERLLAARFGRSLVDHRTWALASAAELMEGVSHEAAALAGRLRLEKLTLLFQASLFEEPAFDDGTGLVGNGSMGVAAGCDDILRRFVAQGWAVQRADAHDPADVAAALSFALRAKKPTLIALRTLPSLGMRGFVAAEMRASLGWTAAPFSIPHDLAEQWQAAGARGAAARRAWLKRMARHPQRQEFERVTSGRLPDVLHETLTALKASIVAERPRLATMRASLKVQEAMAACLPDLLGGAAGPEGMQARPMGATEIGPNHFAGRFLHYGMREHAMAAAMNGIVAHGGLIPACVSQLVLSDYLRPALRLACLTGQRVIHIMTHDAAGEGPRLCQPVEQLAALRAIPGLHVFRPADAMETAEAWDLALRRAAGPSVLVLSRQPSPSLRSDAAENRTARGGYVLAEADGARQATLIASGPEVAAAMTARALLAEDAIGVAVVSLPCWELFAQADPAYRDRVLGGVPRFAIEGASGFGWERWLPDGGIFLGFGGYGISGSYQELYEQGSLMPEAIVAAVKKRLNSAQT